MAVESKMLIDTLSHIYKNPGEKLHASLGVGLVELPNNKTRVSKILKDSAAKTGGIALKDIIVSLDNKEHIDVLSMIDYVDSKKPGDILVVNILRNDVPVVLNITLGKLIHGDDPGQFFPSFRVNEL